MCKGLGVQLKRIRDFGWIIVAFGVCELVSAFVVWDIVPITRGDTGVVAFVGKLFVASLISPIIFVWAWVSESHDFVDMIGVILVPSFPMALLYGYWRTRSLVLLGMSAAMWSSLGVFSIYIIITGSV